MNIVVKITLTLLLETAISFCCLNIILSSGAGIFKTSFSFYDQLTITVWVVLVLLVPLSIFRAFPSKIISILWFSVALAVVSAIVVYSVVDTINNRPPRRLALSEIMEKKHSGKAVEMSPEKTFEALASIEPKTYHGREAKVLYRDERFVYWGYPATEFPALYISQGDFYERIDTGSEKTIIKK